MPWRRVHQTSRNLRLDLMLAAKKHKRVSQRQPVLQVLANKGRRVNPNTTMAKKVGNTKNISLHSRKSNIQKGFLEILAINRSQFISCKLPTKALIVPIDEGPEPYPSSLAQTAGWALSQLNQATCRQNRRAVPETMKVQHMDCSANSREERCISGRESG